MPVTPPADAPVPAKRRRLRPEVAAELAARNRSSQLNALYEKPVKELDPEDIAVMRRAFFRG